MNTRLQGFLQPPTDELRTLRLIIDQKDAGALEKLSNYTPSNDIEAAWMDYLCGLALFDGEKYTEGEAAFHLVVDRAKNQDSPSDLKRLAGMALKKIGWNFRRTREFQKAYAMHEAEYYLFEAAGSFEDLHDACISLDVDSFELKDFNKSEAWLRKGLAWAEQIADPLNRAKALGMCCNNLSGTLCELKRFEEAENMNRASAIQWSAYEERAGTTECRMAWVHVEFGSIYEKWAKFLKENDKSYHELAQKSLVSYRKAMDLGIQCGMGDSGQKFIQERITDVEKM